ncbi:MAG: T9SS type A sorting domain-containing protein [Crocinitomicaceae bacterium]
MKNSIAILLFIIAELLSANAVAASVWNQKPNLPAVGRHRGTGIAIANKGYFGLGHVNGTGVNVVYSDWWEYDPATASWTQKADVPVQTYGAAAFASSTAGYIGGGIFQDDEFYRFDPALNTWTQVADAPVHVNDNIAFCVGDFGYITDGTELYEYNTINDTWTQKQTPPTNIGLWSSATVLQNSAYIKTGSNFYEYKPTSDTWIVKQSYPGIATGGGVAFVINNKCYFLLGYGGSLGNVQKEMYEFDPATGNWTVQPEFPGTSRRFSCGFAINNKGYIGIGTNGINFSDFWEYNRLLSTDEIPTQTTISVTTFPCPAINFINFKIIDSEKFKELTISIYNSLGQKQEELDYINSGSTLSLAKYPSGFYFYSIHSNQSLVTTGQFLKR